MNTKNFTRITIWLVFAATILFSCQEDTLEMNSSAPELKGLANASENARNQAYLQKNVLQITAAHNEGTEEHAYNFSSKELQAGWVTMKFVNPTHSDHFAVFYRVPQEAIEAANDANMPIRDYWYENITVPFQEEFNPYIIGNIDYGTFVNNLVGNILGRAPWFFDPGATTAGGPGFTSPGQVSETTIYLEPGTYIAECYVKDNDQVFHSYSGMLEMLEVTGSYSNQDQPKSTMEVTISSTDGIQYPSSIRPGKHTVAIRFLDQVSYSHLLGHNVQLVRLDNGSDPALIGALGDYMNWVSPVGLVKRSPQGSTFIGGAMEMQAGDVAYYEVNLKPGTYAWVAEVPDPASKGMLKVFQVPEVN